MTLPQDINAVFMLDLNVNRHHNHLFTALIKCHFRFVVKFEVKIKCCTCQMKKKSSGKKHPTAYYHDVLMHHFQSTLDILFNACHKLKKDRKIISIDSICLIKTIYEVFSK